MLPEDWKKIKVPAGLAAALMTGIFAGWIWLHSEFVSAADFKQTVNSMEVRNLERDKKNVETEILKLEVKKEALPAQFNAVDKALLNKHKSDLEEIKKDLKDIKTRK